MDTALCKNRSYDQSRDYARYPTLAPLNGTAPGDRENYLHCPDCGGDAFQFRLADRAHICLRCRRELLPDLPPPAPKVVAIAFGNGHTVALHRDGTVRAVGENSGGQCDVRDWRDITAIAAGLNHTIGLKKDGTVVIAGPNRPNIRAMGQWTGITAIAAGWNHFVGLRSDGTVIAVGQNGSGQCDVQGWTGIRSIVAGANFTLGLRRDGTVAATGIWFHDIAVASLVENWTGITALATDDFTIVGLRSDDTVCSTDSSRWGPKYESWTGIQAIAAGAGNVFALSGGRVLLGNEPIHPSEYLNFGGKPILVKDDEARYNANIRVRSWSDIRTLFAGPDDVIGLKNDGTFVFTSSEREACYRDLFV